MCPPQVAVASLCTPSPSKSQAADGRLRTSGHSREEEPPPRPQPACADLLQNCLLGGGEPRVS